MKINTKMKRSIAYNCLLIQYASGYVLQLFINKVKV